jgi:hypothetical protein
VSLRSVGMGQQVLKWDLIRWADQRALFPIGDEKLRARMPLLLVNRLAIFCLKMGTFGLFLCLIK